MKQTNSGGLRKAKRLSSTSAMHSGVPFAMSRSGFSSDKARRRYRGDQSRCSTFLHRGLSGCTGLPSSRTLGLYAPKNKASAFTIGSSSNNVASSPLRWNSFSPSRITRSPPPACSRVPQRCQTTLKLDGLLVDVFCSALSFSFAARTPERGMQFAGQSWSLNDARVAELRVGSHKKTRRTRRNRTCQEMASAFILVLVDSRTLKTRDRRVCLKLNGLTGLGDKSSSLKTVRAICSRINGMSSSCV